MPVSRCHPCAVGEALYDDNWLAVVQGERLYKIRAGQGRRRPPAPSSSPWSSATTTCRGLCLGSAAQRLMRLYAVASRAARAVVATANDRRLRGGARLGGCWRRGRRRRRPAPRAGAHSDMAEATAGPRPARSLPGHTVFEGRRPRKARRGRAPSPRSPLRRASARGRFLHPRLRPGVHVASGYVPAAALLCHHGHEADLRRGGRRRSVPDHVPRRHAGAAGIGHRRPRSRRGRWPKAATPAGRRRRAQGFQWARRNRSSPTTAASWASTTRGPSSPTPRARSSSISTRTWSSPTSKTRSSRRFRRHRAPQTLFHRRHGSEPGPPVGARHRAPGGARRRDAVTAAEIGNDDRAPRRRCPSLSVSWPGAPSTPSA